MFTVARSEADAKRIETTQSVLDHLWTLEVNRDDAVAVCMALHRPAILSIAFDSDGERITVSREGR